MTKGYLGIDIGSISTKGVIIDENRAIIARSYLWTEGNPTEASKNVVRELERQVEARGDIVGAGTTGSARRLVGAMLGASVIKNEITAHAVGHHPSAPGRAHHSGDRRPGFQDHLRVRWHRGGLRHEHLVRRGHRLVSVVAGAPLGRGGRGVRRHRAHFHQAGQHRRPLHRVRRERSRAQDPGGLCARGHHRGALQRCGQQLSEQRGQGQEDRRARGVPGAAFSKNAGVVHAFEEQLGMPVAVDPDGHLMGAFGAALLAADAGPIVGAESGPFASGTFDFEAMLDFDFKTREIECQKCANHCEVICVYRDKDIIDSWGNRCDKGAVKTTA